jgi:hypothetical protein
MRAASAAAGAPVGSGATAAMPGTQSATSGPPIIAIYGDNSAIGSAIGSAKTARKSVHNSARIAMSASTKASAREITAPAAETTLRLITLGDGATTSPTIDAAKPGNHTITDAGARAERPQQFRRDRSRPSCLLLRHARGCARRYRLSARDNIFHSTTVLRWGSRFAIFTWGRRRRSTRHAAPRSLLSNPDLVRSAPSGCCSQLGRRLFADFQTPATA